MRTLLPINSLRNVALLAADSPLVAMVDVDLMLDRSLSRDLMDPVGDGKAAGAMQAGAVMILPAFETGRSVGRSVGRPPS